MYSHFLLPLLMLYCILLLLIPIHTATPTAYLHTPIPYCYHIIPFLILIPTAYSPLHIAITDHYHHCYIYFFSTHTYSLLTYYHSLLLTVYCYCTALSLLPPLLLHTHIYSSLLPHSAIAYPYSPLPIPYCVLLMQPSPHCYQHCFSAHIYSSLPFPQYHSMSLFNLACSSILSHPACWCFSRFGSGFAHPKSK